MQPIDSLRDSVSGWLARHELNRDTAFYTGEQWRARGERYLVDCAVVLVFEGELYRVVNGGNADSIRLYNDFEEFVRGLGYFFELGHAWSMGFYPLPANRLRTDLSIASTQP
jgi:hypothetical protein